MREITYCLSCKKETRNTDSRIVKTKNNKRVMLYCAIILFAIIKKLYLFHKDLVCLIV